MARVDFYLIPESTSAAAWLLACRLGEKAYQKKQGIYMLTSSPASCQQLDDLLWQFRADSFVPHYAENNTVIIGNPDTFDLLINLTETFPKTNEKFQRIIEIIPNNETDLIRGREHFRLYRQQGHELHSHRLEAK